MMRRLVVEDDPLIREFVVEALREEGYDVIHAASGEEALAWCGQRVADVLITDIKSVDGWQIAERCREHDPKLPVRDWLLARRTASRIRESALAEALSAGSVQAVRQVTEGGPASKSSSFSVRPCRCDW